jgi:hypothetical protein
VNNQQIIEISRQLLATRKIQDPLADMNFLDFCEVVKNTIQDLSTKERESLSTEYLEGFRKLRDDFAEEVRKDPAIIYRPQHKVALEFHKSLAVYRYFFGGNRISKTQCGAMENNWIVTGRHPYRPKPPLPASVFIIGTNFSQYCPSVFEKKYVTGEGGNPLSPLFPEDGKWFNKYDDRKHILYIACPECAEAGKARKCTHLKSTITVFSDVEGPGVLAGGQYALGQLDEQIQEEFFAEAKQRIKTVPNSGLIITETPLYGKAWWTYTSLYKFWKESPNNKFEDSNRQIISCHTISQFDAGLVPRETILADMATMTKPEIEARIYGRHVAASQQAIFDLEILNSMRDFMKEPKRGFISLAGERDDKARLKTAEALIRDGAITFTKEPDIKFYNDDTGNLRLWKRPSKHDQYIIGADVSQGFTDGDASCAHVLCMRPVGSELAFEQVAEYHGWINSLTYAEELFKLGAWYNNALLVVESNGPGNATLQRLKEMGCWFIFRDISDPAQAQFNADSRLGIDTNVRSKGLMISALQYAIKKWRIGRRMIQIYDEFTIEELETYIQELTNSGNSFRYKGIGKAHDDRVMALAFAVYVASTYPVFDFDKWKKVNEPKQDDYTKNFWNSMRLDLKEDEVEDPFFG